MQHHRLPIIVAFTKVDLIDNNIDIVGAGSSEMSDMVKGKERTDGFMQILHTICFNFSYALLHMLFHSFLVLVMWQVADGADLFCTTPQPTTLLQYTPHVPFVPACPAPAGALDDTNG